MVKNCIVCLRQPDIHQNVNSIFNVVNTQVLENAIRLNGLKKFTVTGCSSLTLRAENARQKNNRILIITVQVSNVSTKSLFNRTKKQIRHPQANVELYVIFIRNSEGCMQKVDHTSGISIQL